MNIESVLYEHNGLKMATKRYRRRSDASDADLNVLGGLTLFLAHGIGLNKEQWEPTVANLFASVKLPKHRFKIREAWTFDWQNHGDSAVHNAKALKNRSKLINVKTWGEAISAFMRSEHVKDHRIVAIGHSAGASAIMHSTLGMSDEDSIKYHAMILIEPPVIEPGVLQSNDEEHTAIIQFYSQAIRTRRFMWTSRTSALEYLQKRPPWDRWDIRTLQLFVEHALRDALDKDGKACVMLKCSPEQEATMYWEYPTNFDGINILDRSLHLFPVYAVFAECTPPSPAFVHASAVKMCKLRHIPDTHLVGVNHLVPQENPDLLAKSLADILTRISSPDQTSRVASKL